MSKFNITRADIKTATGWGEQRIRTLLQSPTKLLYVSKGNAETKGRHIEHFKITDIFPRLRERGASLDVIKKLVAMDHARRMAGEV